MRNTFAPRALLAASLLVACSAPFAAMDESPGSSVAPAEAHEFEVLVLEHEEADALAATLNEFIADASRGGTAEPETKVLADPRTNSLLVMATASRLVEIRTLVALLDVADPE